MTVFNRLISYIFISTSLAVAQSDMELGIKNYSDRSSGSTESKASKTIISSAIHYFENAIKIKNFEHFLLNEGGFIYDINYSNDTNFKLKDLSLSKNANFYNGVGMLVEQAAECFRLWFDKKPSVEEVKNLLNERV